MNIILNVPFSEKDTAKKLGAKWNSKIKKWYIPYGTDEEKFNRWRTDNSVVETCTITEVTQENMKQHIRHLFNEFEELP